MIHAQKWNLVKKLWSEVTKYAIEVIMRSFWGHLEVRAIKILRVYTSSMLKLANKKKIRLLALFKVPNTPCRKSALWYILRLVIFAIFRPLIDLGWPPNVIFSLLMSSPDEKLSFDMQHAHVLGRKLQKFLEVTTGL